MLKIIKKENYKHQLEIFRNAISNRRVRILRNFPTFVFLCGANIDENTISARRNRLLQFAEKKLPKTRFFLAESLLPDLQDAPGYNLLDFENNLSTIADKIIIILESPSAFAELGAFCRKSLRDKIIVINDAKFKHSKSFVNLGPLKAVEQASGKGNIISYKMNEDGLHQPDSIGAVFDPLFKLLNKSSGSGRFLYSAVKLDQCDPSKEFNKFSVMMTHDLVYLCGPILRRELVEILKLIFGPGSFNISEHLEILQAIKFLVVTEDGLYKSKLGSPFYDYKIDINKLISVFRNYILKYCPERIYGN